MTVIAWDGKTLASDSLTSTSAGHVVGKVKKLFRLKAGGIVGTAGDADARSVIALLDNIKEENDLPTKVELESLRTAGEFILVLPDKTVWYIDIIVDEDTKTYKAQVYPTGDKFAVAGHGYTYAKAAMACGQTAAQAVQIACKYSLACAGPVQQMKLEDKPKEKIKRVRQPKPVLHEAE